MESDYPVFNSNAPEISRLPEGQLSKKQLLNEDFEIHRWADLAMYYAPFDFINSAARLAIIGITPGWTQMEIAFRVARNGLGRRLPSTEILRNAKDAASFAGQMRVNLISMLDELEVQYALSISSSGDLFRDQRELIHTTSAIRFPVFSGGQNYTGHKPKLLEDAYLRDFMVRNLMPELHAVPEAFIIPLGKTVDATVQYLVDQNMLNGERCARGFPHPSPANGHRRSIFEENREALRRAIRAWF